MHRMQRRRETFLAIGAVVIVINESGIELNYENKNESVQNRIAFCARCERKAGMNHRTFPYMGLWDYSRVSKTVTRATKPVIEKKNRQ